MLPGVVTPFRDENGSFNGKPKASANTAPVAFGLPLNE